ncbi:hypothetical protein [Dictyobacter kobayashii]|nr:hypothetical protein [Dictyobacter kobayashii]
MPAIEPSQDAHSKLMQALAAEHVRFLQRTPASASSTPTPVFLAPYLKDLAKQTEHADSLAAFSTADTGPLPIIQATRPRRSRQSQHFAIIGLAASFLVVVMLSGLISLLFLANQGQQVVQLPSNPVIISRVEIAQADTATTSTQTSYAHVASAITSNNTIFYSAYNEDGSNWMLEKFDTTGDPNTNHESIPLLATPSTRPLILLGGNKDWLLWLQMETPKRITGRHTHAQTTQQDTQPGKLTGSWSLKALYVGQDPNAQNTQAQQDAATDFAKPLTIHSDIFNSSTVADWVNTPIQGVSFYNDHALVALIDNKGTSHLLNYQFAQNTLAKTTELATAQDQHVLTSPAASSDGNNIYWADEWLNTNHQLNSNIWTQQIVEAAPSKTGRWIPHPQAQTYLYRDDSASFRPQMVDDTLFFLNRDNSTASATSTTTPTPGVTATAADNTVTPTATATAQADATTTPQDVSKLLGNPTEIDPTVITPQVDAEATGKLLAFTANGSAPVNTNVSDNEILTGLQSGGLFLIWQNSSTKEFKMYDTRAKVMVNGINTIDKSSTAFVSVNDTTVIWTKYLAPDPNNANSESDVTFTTLKWPK